MGRRCSKRPKLPSCWDGTSIAARISDLPPTAQKLCAFLGIYATASVRADHLPRFIEGLELVQPDAALLELSEPALDERLALGVAVAAAAMCDAQPGKDELERAGGKRRAVVGAQRQRPSRDAARGHRLLDQRDALRGAAAQLELTADDLAGAAVDGGQQSMAAVR
jgi:hypothetical protein